MGDKLSDQIEEQKKLEEKMREIDEKNRAYIKKLVEAGKLPEPKPLTRKQRKELDLSGLHLYKQKKNDERTFGDVKDQMCDWILEKVYPGFDFDTLEDRVCGWFAMYIFNLSYRDDLSEKNL